jgi:DNA-binding CsgD family transcriptional regulator
MTVDPSSTRPPRLLGRELELGAIARLLDAAEDGQGAVLLLSGPAGIGKTQLIEEACADAAGRGMTVLGARASEGERGFAFGVARQLFEPALYRLGDRQRAAALGGAAELAGELLTRGPSAAPPRSSFAMFHGLYWLAVNLSQQGPLLLAVDDLPACDELSQRFLVLLTRRIAGLRIAIVMAARGEASARRPPVVADLLETDAVEPIEVPKLDKGPARRLARTLLESDDDVVIEAVVGAADGNPLYLREIARTFREGRDEGGAPLGPDGVAHLGPRIVARTAALRMAQCGPDAMELGHALAVLGEDAPPVRALRLAGLPEDRGGAAMAALLAAGILAEDERRVRFSHPLIRAAIYEELPLAHRGALHRRAAELLEDEGAPVEAVATQLMGAPPEASGATIRMLRAAARIALRQEAASTAVTYLRRALAEPPGAERGEVLHSLGEAELAMDPDAAIGHLAEALALADATGRRSEIAQTLARAQAARGRRREAAETIEQALRELDPGDERFARLLADYAAMGAFETGLRRRTLDLMDEWLRDSHAGRTPAERALLAQAGLRSAQEARNVADTAELARRAWGKEALLADEGPDGPSWLLVVWAQLLAQELPRAEGHLGTVIAESRRRGALMAFATASYFRAETRLRLGRLVDAQADCEAALAIRDLGWQRFPAAAAAAHARVLVERGFLAEAEVALGVVEDARLEGTMELPWVLLARARLSSARRESADALRLALTAGELLSGEFGVRHTILPWRPFAAMIAIDCNQAPLAAELIAEEEAIASQAGLPISTGRALRVRARLESGERSREMLEAAAAKFEQGSATLERAFALAELGAALRRGGQRVESREVLRVALDLAHGCDARLLATSIREELAASGARLRREAVSGVDALTPSERRVAGLAAGGMTNSEIAQNLFVTIKTVEFHLANTYRKLDINGRTALAGALDQVVN